MSMLSKNVKNHLRGSIKKQREEQQFGQNDQGERETWRAKEKKTQRLKAKKKLKCLVN